MSVAEDKGSLLFSVATYLDERQQADWRAFAARLPWSHYQQDPGWAAIESRDRGMHARRPLYFWASRGSEIKLTALGVRRQLPIPGRVFLEFNRGPLCGDADVLDNWLGWLSVWGGRSAARIRVQPALPLHQGGDDIETVLERQHFARRRILGVWTTLTVDLDRPEEEILADFRPETRRALRKSVRLGLQVSDEDAPEGWAALASLQSDLAGRQPVERVDRDDLARISQAWLAGGRGGTVLVVRLNGEPLAAGLVIVYRRTAYLPLVPSSTRHREVPSSHLLVWEAMRWAKSHSCGTFDFVGYSMTARPGEALWGINQFKRGFASLDHLSKSVAVHERVCDPFVVGVAAAARRTERCLHKVGGRRSV